MVNRDNLGIIFLIVPQKIHCDPSLESSRPDGSNEGSQCMFLLRNKKNYLGIIVNTLSYLELCYAFHKPKGYAALLQMLSFHHKTSKYCDTLINYCNCPRNKTIYLYNAVMHQNGIAKC